MFKNLISLSPIELSTALKAICPQDELNLTSKILVGTFL